MSTATSCCIIGFCFFTHTRHTRTFLTITRQFLQLDTGFLPPSIALDMFAHASSELSKIVLRTHLSFMQLLDVVKRELL